MAKAQKNWSGERLETFIENRDTIDHLHRYAVAADYAAGKTVLDIASGEGYGSHLMANVAAKVFGVDIDAETVARAKSKYKKPNLEYRQGSADAIPLADASVDVVVSFETIEHHDRHDEMMAEIKRVLKPGGLTIISTPDKLYYTDKRNFANKFHVKELYKEEFAALIGRYFGNLQLLNQTYVNGNSILRREESAEKMNLYTGDYSGIRASEADPLYLVAIASDFDFQRQDMSIFDGAAIVAAEARNLYTQSHSYRLGQFLLSPVRWAKRLLK
jgi:ubiquinone/menaquinone biosynthesis C-methylase UbiE